MFHAHFTAAPLGLIPFKARGGGMLLLQLLLNSG